MKCTPANKAILIYGLPAPPSSGRQIYIMIKDSITQSTTNQTLWRLKIKLNAIFQLFGIIVMFYNFKNELAAITTLHFSARLHPDWFAAGRREAG